MIHSWVTLITLIGVLAGCVTETVKTASVPTLATYESELADDEILDIAVVVFDPGIAEADVEAKLEMAFRSFQDGTNFDVTSFGARSARASGSVQGGDHMEAI